MDLYLIENDRTIDKLLGSDSYTPGRDIIICFNYLVLLRMQRESPVHCVVFLEELLDGDGYKQLHETTDAFAMDWYKVGGEDITRFEDVSFGMLVESMFPRKFMLNTLVKIGEVMRRAIERWGEARTFYCDFSNQGNAQRYCEGWSEQFFDKIRTVELVARQLGRPVHRIEAPSIIPPMWFARMHATSIRDHVKARLKRLLTFGINALGAPARLVPKAAVFVFGYHNLQSVQPGEGKRLITNNYKFLRKSPGWLLSGGRVLDLDHTRFSLDAPAVGFLRRLKERIESEDCGNSDELYMLNGISYCDLYRPAVLHVVGTVIPDLLRAMRHLRRNIRRHNIEKIMFIDTIDTISRAQISACRQEGCKTLVVYHGLFENISEQKVIKRRIAPDILVTPGDPKYSPQYISNFLTPPGRILSNFGSPIIDPYLPSKRKRVEAIRRVVFLTMNDGFYCNLSRFPWQEKYLAEIMSTFRTLTEMGIEVHYRAHPGENTEYNRYLFDFFGIDTSKIHTSNKGSFHDVIYDMDLMVTNISTAFFESQAAGVPTVFLDPYYEHDAVQPPLNGINGKDVLRIATGEELLDIVRRNQHDPGELNTFLDTFLEQYAPRYVGPIDGQSGKRIGDYISGTMKESARKPIGSQLLTWLSAAGLGL